MANSELPELFFYNPLHLPLEKLYLKIKKVKGGDEQIKALDKFWIAERFYPCYSHIPKIESQTNRDKWLKRANNYIKTLFYIINLPYYKFLSYVLYEPAVSKMLDSFLRHAEPCYLPEPSAAYEQPYSTIYNLVFRIYKRILTPKESETEFITPRVLGKLLKDNDVITSYTMWDICKLYGHVDDGTIANLVEFAYEVIPELKEELEVTIRCTVEIFEAIGTAAYENENATEQLVTKLTNLLFETAFAIKMFMKIYPAFKDVCLKENLFSRILHTYDHEINILYNLMQMVCISEIDPAYDLVDNARVEILQICHNLTSYCLDQIIQKSENSSEKSKWIETYLNFMVIIVQQDLFLTDFDRCFPINQDIEMLLTICPEVDKEKCKYILSVIDKLRAKENQLEEEVLVNGQNGTELLDEATVPEQVILDSQITELMDMFPDYGDGFLEQCLLQMNMDSQQVIMAILEDNLPSNLAELDRCLPRIPPESPEPEPFNGETFIEKKPEYKDATELLDDKIEIEDIKEKILSYRNTAYDMYDDDYDDSFDHDYTVGIDSFNSEELQQPKRYEKQIESEEDDEEENEEEKPPRDAFCEDPAVLRARRETRYQQNRRGPPPNKNKDVVGKQVKGQGQDKQVLQNREKKNINKSSRANHNRRQGAQWKRSRGMMPS